MLHVTYYFTSTLTAPTAAGKSLACDIFNLLFTFQVSVFLLLLCCMIITVGQFFKNPIDCIVTKDLVPQVSIH